MNAINREAPPAVVLRHMTDTMPGGFFVYRNDTETTLLYTNDITLDIFGCGTLDEFKELTGYTFKGMVHPDDLPAVENSIDCQIAQSNKKLDYVEYRIRRKDGSIRWVDDYGRLVHTEEEGDLYYVLIRDITEQRAMREETRRMELELAREKHANEIKSSFLFSISHDIRTPMNAIVGFTELAKRHMDDPGALREYIDKVDEGGRHMMTLLDNLLEMSNIDYGRIELKNSVCDLRAQLEEAVAAFRPQAEEKRLSLETDLVLPSQPVILDAEHFRRVLDSLIDNAVKFTPAGGRVRVSARQKKISASGYARYEFVVSDNGVGIDEEFLGRVFQPFEREESSTKSGYLGTGLGLSIAKSLLQLMGGSVSVTSKKGEGSVFTVDLPLKLAEQATPRAEAKRVDAASAKADGERRLLLVEDIDVNRIMAEIMLKEAGFLVESVPDGCDAVDAVKDHEPWYYDAILMDIQMPVMNGYEATRAIRALDRDDARLMPIIALSANAREQDRQMSRESGMDDHIAKPFDLARLIATLNDYIAAADAKR